MTERRKFGEFKQNRFITFVEIDNSCGIEDLMKQIRYKGFREKDFQKLCSIREELNQLYYENEVLQHENRKLKYTNADNMELSLHQRHQMDKLSLENTSLKNENKELKISDNNKSHKWSIIDEEFISYTGGYAYLISDGDCEFHIWERKNDVQKVCDKLNKLISKNNELEDNNKSLQFKIIDILDFITENDGVTRQEMKDWWNNNIKGDDVK